MKVYELVDKLLLLNQELPVAYWDNEYSEFDEVNEISIQELKSTSKGYFTDFFPKSTTTIEVAVLC